MDSPLDNIAWRGSVWGTQAALVELRILGGQPPASVSSLSLQRPYLSSPSPPLAAPVLLPSGLGSLANDSSLTSLLQYIAMCDEIVISPGSTFGRAAHMWASKLAYVLQQAQGNRYSGFPLPFPSARSLCSFPFVAVIPKPPLLPISSPPLFCPALPPLPLPSRQEPRLHVNSTGFLL